MRRENINRLLALTVSVVLTGSVGLAFFEDKSWPDALWLSIVTMSTVGYGDLYPTTGFGRAIGALLMLVGIGVLGMFSASIAGMLVEKSLKRNRGMDDCNLTGHLILCGWNGRSGDIVKELRSDSRTHTLPIVLVAELETSPIDEEHFHFVRGPVTEENLMRARLQDAETVIILSDDRLPLQSRDAESVLSTLAVESINPKAYTIVELVHADNVKHCERARADEIIAASEFGSRLLSRAARDHGITNVISRLLSSHYPNDLYKQPVSEEWVGRSFLEVFIELKKSANATVLGIQRTSNGEVLANPVGDLVLEAGDSLILISEDRGLSS